MIRFTYSLEISVLTYKFYTAINVVKWRGGQDFLKLSGSAGFALKSGFDPEISCLTLKSGVFPILRQSPPDRKVYQCAIPSLVEEIRYAR